MTTQYEIGVIGAGNAAEGIVHGVLRNSMLLDDRIVASDIHEPRRRLFADRFGIAVTDDNRSLIENSFVVILAVKPQQFAEVLAGVAEAFRRDHLVVSIMAGVSTRAIEALLSHIPARVVRAMPNLPMHVGAGMTGLVAGSHASEADLLRAQRVFDAGGKTVVVENETLMDAITAVSGTGPAYFYYFAEAVGQAGRELGLPSQQADLLARQACLGAARMMLETNDPPAELRRKVTSKGGTTEAAVDAMKRSEVFEHIQEAVRAAWLRSRELGA